MSFVLIIEIYIEIVFHSEVNCSRRDANHRCMNVGYHQINSLKRFVYLIILLSVLNDVSPTRFPITLSHYLIILLPVLNDVSSTRFPITSSH